MHELVLGYCLCELEDILTHQRLDTAESTSNGGSQQRTGE